jgi:hypothetical protein
MTTKATKNLKASSPGSQAGERLGPHPTAEGVFNCIRDRIEAKTGGTSAPWRECHRILLDLVAGERARSEGSWVHKNNPQSAVIRSSRVKRRAPRMGTFILDLFFDMVKVGLHGSADKQGRLSYNPTCAERVVKKGMRRILTEPLLEELLLKEIRRLEDYEALQTPEWRRHKGLKERLPPNGKLKEEGSLEWLIAQNWNNPLISEGDRAVLKEALAGLRGGEELEWEASPVSPGGRKYGSLQNLSKRGKQIIFEGTRWLDIDIKRAHPHILLQILRETDYQPKTQKVLLPTLVAWVEHFELLAARARDAGHSPQQLKEEFCGALYGRKRGLQTLSALALRAEMPRILRHLFEEGLISSRTGSALFRLIEKYERRALDALTRSLEGVGGRVIIPMFDGAIVDAAGVGAPHLVEAGERAIREELGWELHLTVKSTF